MTDIHARISYMICITLCLLLPGACKQSAQAPSLSWSVYNQGIPNQPQLVYTFKQRAGVPMVVKAWGHEVEFELSITDPGKQQSHNTQTPYIRLGPQFQLLPKKDVDTEITVVLTPLNFTKNAHFSIEAYQLSESDHAGRRQIEAYRLISEALESTQSEKAEIWQEKVKKLRDANQIFKQLGQDEIRMWVDVYAANFTYFPLYQYDAAISQSKNLEREAREQNQTEIELLALQIQGQALIEQNTKDSEEVVRKKFLHAQSIFDRAAIIAGNNGFDFERAWISNNKCVGFLYSGDPAQALIECDHAESIASNLADQFLLSMVQHNIVTAYADSGDPRGAIDALTLIRESLSVLGNQTRIAQIDAQIANLHGNLYEFPQAIDGLSSALIYFDTIGDQETLGRTRLSLASAYFEVGNLPRATELLDQAVREFNSANYGGGLFLAHGLLADLYRHLGEHQKMGQHRDEQLSYVTTDYKGTLVVFEHAKDLYVQGHFGDSLRQFKLAHDQASASKWWDLEVLSRLYQCLIEFSVEQTERTCLVDPKSTMLTGIQKIGNVRTRLEGLFLWAQIQQKANRKDEAYLVLDQLVEDIRFYRTSLPGVLGAWFWENNKQVFEAYLRLSANRAEDASSSSIDSLRALQKIKSIYSRNDGFGATAQSSKGDFEAAKAIRVLIANSESGHSQLSDTEISTQLDHLILSTSTNPIRVGQDGESDDLNKILENLPESSALLAIYPFADETYVWVANKQEVILRKLAQGIDVSAALKKVKKEIRYQGNASIEPELKSMGRAILQPVMALLPKTIFFLPLGEFNGFPLDALKINDQYLIESHQVINLISLDSLSTAPASKPLQSSTHQIFFAGNQRFDDSSLMDLPGISVELTDIKKIFNESDIHVAIGENLSVETFYGPEISKADIIHIASHALLDVNYPELSRIYLNALSAERPGTAESILVPTDIRAGTYTADLVVLSACQTSGFNHFTFDSNLGFVSQFIASGAHSVVATLWAIPDRDSAAFMHDFYSALKEDANVPISLTYAKRSYLRNNPSSRADTWAAFQVFK